MDQAAALALLDLEGSERFALPEGLSLVAAADLPHEAVIASLHDHRVFMKVVAGGYRMPYAAVEPLQAYWRDQQGLVDGDDLQRLMWILGHFRREVEVDLLQRVGVRLRDLWQKREWRLLLNLIDHLPRATWTWSRMANHPDYAERVASAVAKQRHDSSDEATPPLVEWSQEAALLAGVIDSVNALRRTLIQVNLERGKDAPTIPPYPRPRTLVDTMVDKKERQLRWADHESLAARVLPDRQKS